MQRLMAQPQRMLGYHLVEFRERRTAPLPEQRLVASEGFEPVARCGAGRCPAQFQQQLADVGGARNHNARRRGCRLQKMQMRINEAWRDGPPAQPDQVGPGSDQRLEVRIAAARHDAAAGDRKRIALRMAENLPFVENQIGLCATHL